MDISRPDDRLYETSPKVTEKVSKDSRPVENQKSCDLGKVSKLPSSEVSTLTANGVHLDRRGIRRDTDKKDFGSKSSPYALSQPEFCRLLALRVNEICEGKSDGSTRRSDVGST